jgi:molybdopterin-guanine dinucleotide biosynthesis protein A
MMRPSFQRRFADMPAPPLFGLVLAGGASTRMQRDKAALSYHGKPQLQWTYELLLQHCAAVFVSVRPEQRLEPTRAGLPQIIDREGSNGPIAGISAALAEHPKVAWLVVACDLPFVDAATLTRLIEQRAAQRIATAYRSSHDGLPEPLCAIWEPAAREPLAAQTAAGLRCPRKFLINADTCLLDLPSAAALDNVNTTAEFAVAQTQLHAKSAGAEPTIALPTIALKVQYFALFREQAGRSEELLDTTAATPEQLYRELQTRHPFKLNQQQLKVAVNAGFSDWQAALKSGDTVVFIPPVAGG